MYTNIKNVFTILIVFGLSYGCDNQHHGFDTDLIPVKTSDRALQYITPKGDVSIHHPEFTEIYWFKSGVALVKTDQWYGYINKKGIYVVSPKYKHALSFSEGMAWVVEPDGMPTVINDKGEALFTLKEAEKVYAFSEGLAIFATKTEDGHLLYGYVDKKGEIVIPPQFADVHPFVHGKAVVYNEEGKAGVIDRSGALVINYLYDACFNFEHKNYAVVRQSGKYGIIDTKGNYIIQPQFESLTSDGIWLLAKREKKFGWCDVKGKTIIDFQFDYAHTFGDSHYAPVGIGDKYGFIDRTGKLTINPQYDGSGSFIGSIAPVIIDDKIGFINAKGAYMVNPIYRNIPDIEYFWLPHARKYIISDFFDVQQTIDGLASLLKDNAIDGITFDMSFADIMDKYHLAENSINKYASQHQLTEIPVSDEVGFIISMLGKPYNEVYNGWFGTRKVLNKNYQPAVYVCNITLKGKGLNKKDGIYDAILKAFDASDEDRSFTVGNLLVQVSNTPKSSIAFTISPKLDDVHIPKTEIGTEGYSMELYQQKKITPEERQCLKIDDVEDQFVRKLPNRQIAKGEKIYQGKNGRIESILVLIDDHMIREYLMSYNKNGDYVDQVIVGERILYAGDQTSATIEGSQIHAKTSWGEPLDGGSGTVYTEYTITPTLHFKELSKVAKNDEP